MPNRRSKRGARKSQPPAGEMPKKSSSRRGGRRSGPNAQQLRFTPNLPFPESVRTTFFCEADYKIPIATASITSGAVKLNSPWLPFRPGGSSAFSSFTFLGPATESTLLPTGWSVLANANMYQFVKVLRSTIRIRWNGSNSGNNVVVTVIPTFNTASFATIYTARAAPMARQATFSVSKSNTGTDRGGWFTYSMDPYKLLAATRSEEKGDIQVGTGLFDLDPNVTLWWQIYFQSNDTDVSSTTASLLQVKVQYDVELYGLTQSTVTLAEIAGAGGGWLPGRLSVQDGHAVPREPEVCEGRRVVQRGVTLPTGYDYVTVNADPAVLLSARRVPDR